jgi:LPXTG-site transpeptidase (sortase) family protein
MRGTTRGRGNVAVAVALAAVAATLLAVGLARQEPTPPSPPQSAQKSAPTEHVPAPSASPSPDGTGRATRGPFLPESEPVRIEVPRLGISSPLERLGRQHSGAMETPQNPDRAGWYAPGPTPGEQGPAAIAGHVTWNGDRSVFFRLGELEKGDRVHVLRKDGRTAVFEVQRTERYPKEEFPTIRVYQNIEHAGLRLITCGGEFNEATHYYSDNVVVFASLVDGDA